MSSAPIQIVGRSSSHFTRVTVMFAHELGVPFELVPVYDLTRLDPEIFADNPALKVPTLRRGGTRLFGTENICRALARLAADSAPRVLWPEQLESELLANMQELVWHGMASQVTLVLGTVVHGLPADHAYFRKVRTSFEGSLAWLERSFEPAQSQLRAHSPDDAARLSLLEVSLFCLLTHLQFRPTLPLEPYPTLLTFAQRFSERLSAQRSLYRVDVPTATSAAPPHTS